MLVAALLGNVFSYQAGLKMGLKIVDFVRNNVPVSDNPISDAEIEAIRLMDEDEDILDAERLQRELKPRTESDEYVDED